MSEEVEVPIGQALEDALKTNSTEQLESHEDALDASGESDGSAINLDALLEVPVTLSVEIGRSKVPIKQLVSLNQGSVIELDRKVKEPLDLLVNGKLMARGEVVVVDGQFGLRLIDIVSPPDRLKNLK
ncbi:MAG TPA: flagellar motor switch protein FliN [Thiolapillus brandeum]|uniref:Flagellar motor switch protein FliN n=1 Tax=Thiolapillus brandeum TaxID=1076588 RepID=A0A831JQC5_9GAMM|nr:flagellar motor switch protein FliN [Thiolapillus brandeum]